MGDVTTVGKRPVVHPGRCFPPRGKKRRSDRYAYFLQNGALRSEWRDERMGALHAAHSISGHACNVPLAEGRLACACACESARAGLFRSGVVRVASAGSLCLCRGSWCGVRNENYFRHVTCSFRWLVGFACAHDQRNPKNRKQKHTGSRRTRNPTASKAPKRPYWGGS